MTVGTNGSTDRKRRTISDGPKVKTRNKGRQMICYMPFSYIEDNIIKKITTVVGPVSVYGPASEAVPRHMQTWVENGSLQWRFPQQVNGRELVASMQEFKSWATLHQGKLSDMVAYFKSQGEAPPFVDETDPTQIGHQIRQYGKIIRTSGTDPVFQAALFMAMAQEYDEQFAAVDQQIDSVRSLEKAMLSQLRGPTNNGAELDAFLPPSPESESKKVIDRGSHMTAKRVQSWAILVQQEHPEFRLYATTSSAVFDYMMDFFPEAYGPLVLDPLTWAEDKQASKGSFAQRIETLSQAKNPEQALLNFDSPHPNEAGTGMRLSLSIIAGLDPQDFPGRLLGKNNCFAANAVSRNTLLAYICL